MIDCYRTWVLRWLAPTPRKRSRITRFASAGSSETLESRCLLSAVMTSPAEADVTAECNTVAEQPDITRAKGHARSAPRKTTFPNISGSWTWTVHLGETDIVGALQLTQKGKKVTGTLTREFQPPGTLKGKLKVQKNPTTPRDADDAAFFFLFGNVRDVSVASQNVRFGVDLISPEGGPAYSEMEGVLHGPSGDVDVSGSRNIG